MKTLLITCLLFTFSFAQLTDNRPQILPNDGREGHRDEVTICDIKWWINGEQKEDGYIKLEPFNDHTPMIYFYNSEAKSLFYTAIDTTPKYEWAKTLRMHLEFHKSDYNNGKYDKTKDAAIYGFKLDNPIGWRIDVLIIGGELRYTISPISIKKQYGISYFVGLSYEGMSTLVNTIIETFEKPAGDWSKDYGR